MTMDVSVDSTVLLYNQDLRYPTKQTQSASWLKTLTLSNRLAVSPQTLNETYAVVRRKPEFIHWRGEIRSFLEDLFPHVIPNLTTTELISAWRIQDRYQTSFWDALQLAVANAASCTHFLSEDLNDGQTYGTVKVINPFRHTPADVLGPALQP
jgi:predicted nucleic acid-binding protein